MNSNAAIVNRCFMANLQVKGVDDAFYEDLKRLAAAENRSVSQQVVVILRDYLARRANLAKRPETEAHGRRREPRPPPRRGRGDSREGGCRRSPHRRGHRAREGLPCDLELSPHRQRRAASRGGAGLRPSGLVADRKADISGGEASSLQHRENSDRRVGKGWNRGRLASPGSQIARLLRGCQ